MPRIVQCHGCFDPLHIGHIRHFQAAKQHGDRLIVTVTADQYVNKGPGRPVFSDALRMEAVQALACVDEVRLSGHPTAAESIREIRPAVFAKGPDYTKASLHTLEWMAIKEVGAQLLITDTQKWSSTALIAQTDEVNAYLSQIRAKYSAADVKSWLEKARSLRVLVIGDAITDEYEYIHVDGKSGKDPVLVGDFLRVETMVGGAEAVAAHAKAASDHVTCVTGSPIVKRRLVNDYPFQKMLEVYKWPTNQPRPMLIELHDADVVIVADYGHGFLDGDDIELICARSRYLAVNTQANAGNHGFNTISKYSRADFISLSERELRLDARDEVTDVRYLAKHASQDRNGATVLVTRGEKGCKAWDKYGVPEHAPALTTHAVDRTGAGDAVFAVTACLAAVGMPLDLLTFMASVVGTQAVGIVGNARYIERESLVASVETWLS